MHDGRDHPGLLGTLPCALYLLACDIEKEKLTKRDVIGHVLRAAVLIELGERGCLRDDRGRAAVVAGRGAGEPFLDLALGRLAARRRSMRWKTLVTVDRKETVQAVEAALVEAGAVLVEPRPWRSRRVVVREPLRVMELRSTVLETLRSGVPAGRVGTREAALVALSAAGELPAVLSGRERRQHKARIKELTERAGAAAPALRKAIRDMQHVAGALAGGAAGGGT
ncbi:GPP34 family phosphoprotein [Streptomyces sp. HNM0574]|uniref:GOLPH3/VPS74 family protein n=1 Tax=Streptomyces sp. HNM0574 TaxID=2714954 RepID=UPI00146B8B0E|nr:GPP34 family phosphoprotein [Streptomyces sp. HNM0574]NLU67368.1 GPP34 family phosphoprotein [Streptomyces sp. HNM0574]